MIFYFQNPSIPVAERPAAAQEISLCSLANRGALTQTWEGGRIISQLK